MFAQHLLANQQQKTLILLQQKPYLHAKAC